MRVSLVECKTYNYMDMRKSIEEIFNNIGGIEKYIKKGSTVLLKVNLLMKKKPEEATTTHPLFVKALGDVILDYGANVIVGDSPGGPFNKKVLTQLYRYCEYESTFLGSEIKLNFNVEETDLYLEDAKIVKKIKALDLLNEVDSVITVAKFKTHQMTKFTGAVKNLFGIVPGIQKAEYHFRMPEINDFADALVDICMHAKPILAFMDAIVGMQGDGPSAGDPREIGCILGSESPYHLDIVASQIASINPLDVPTIERAVDRGLCKKDFSDIEVVGESIERFRIDDFKAPHIRSLKMLSMLPNYLEKPLALLLKPRPVFMDDLCVGCGECARACPPQVIDMKNKKPVVRLDKCIRCFCCQELCPYKAVKVHRSWLLKTLNHL